MQVAPPVTIGSIDHICGHMQPAHRPKGPCMHAMHACGRAIGPWPLRFVFSFFSLFIYFY
jgi:hypothetical protein